MQQVFISFQILPLIKYCILFSYTSLVITNCKFSITLTFREAGAHLFNSDSSKIFLTILFSFAESEGTLRCVDRRFSIKCLVSATDNYKSILSKNFINSLHLPGDQHGIWWDILLHIPTVVIKRLFFPIKTLISIPAIKFIPCRSTFINKMIFWEITFNVLRLTFIFFLGVVYLNSNLFSFMSSSNVLNILRFSFSLFTFTTSA